MNKSNFILVFLSLLSVFFLAGCDTYEQLYGDESLPLDDLEDISSEIEKTLGEVLPAEVDEESTDEEVAEEIPIEEESEEVMSIAEDIFDILSEELDEKGEVIDEGEELTDEEALEEELDEDTTISEEDIAIIEEIIEEAQVEEAIAIIVQETELVSLVTEAQDPDEDQIIFTFSSPLDEDGEWQTAYGDAGEYTVTVTASDSQLTTSQNVLIIVNKKEEKPTIDSFEPQQLIVIIKETEDIDFEIEASDLNRDELDYSWKLDGAEVSTGKAYTYETTYDDSGSHTIKVDVSDDNDLTSQLWSVTVENTNRKPVMEEISLIEVKENEVVIIAPDVVDPDGDEISFTISDPVGDEGVWETTYDDAGEYTVTVTASDGTDTVSQDVKILVENVNRAPIITGIVQKS